MNLEIKIEKGVKYLGDSIHFKELPTDCIFDKGKVGCGGTTLAIESGKPYVIAVPFVSLIENKMSQHPNVFGVQAGVTVDDIRAFVATTDSPVIMTTYDGMNKVVKAIDCSAFNLLVDEYHLLFLQYAFRRKAMDFLLDSYRAFNTFCFMTATPLEEEFILDELKDVRTINAIWEDTTYINVKAVNCVKGVKNSTVDLVNQYLEGQKGNLYLFVNSVGFIKDLVRTCKLTKHNCNVIYSKYNDTEIGIERGTLPSTFDAPTKRINLLTSTVFEGCDIYDEEGKVYIVSDGSLSHTLVDISTSFQQIAGRIRNSKYLGEVTHLYSTTRYSELDYPTFKLNMEKEIADTKVAIEEFNSMSKATRDKVISGMAFNAGYFSQEDGSLIFDVNLVKVDMFNFKVCKHLYSIRVNNLNEAYAKASIKSTQFTHESEVSITKDDLEGFKKTVEELERYSGMVIYTKEMAKFRMAAFKKYPFILSAINKLGFDGIKELDYVQTNIKRKLCTMLDVNVETKIYKMLKMNISLGEFIPAKLAKTRLAEIYRQLGLTKVAKGSDIESFYNVNPVSKRIDGKVVKGYVILTPKFILK